MSELFEKFPEMKPIRSAPSLGTINGIGTSVVGRRDFDPETGTYVTTQCFCVLFIPIVAIGAYRVADAPQGWYFVGKVPLSPFARTWNLLLLLAIVSGVGYSMWHSHTNSPEYIAGKRLEEADRLIQAGKLGEGAQKCREVVLGGARSGEAIDKLDAILAQQAPLTELAAALQVAVELRAQAPRLTAKRFDWALALARQHAADDPRGSLALLEAATFLAQDPKALDDQKLALLEAIVKQEPKHPEYASRLAVIYESKDQAEKCLPLLAPLADQLGTTEGARILGQIYARDGKFDQAHALLVPYTEGRLKRLHEAEDAFNATYKQLNDGILAEMNRGSAPGFDYARFKRSADAEKGAMVDEYIGSRVKDHAQLQAAMARVRGEASIVPVALDLGIVLLRRGQGMADPAARKAELEKAEKTFLAVRGIAGKSDQFRLFLGQVYFWLGRQAEGRKLFDETLASKGRDTETMLMVANLLREVGDDSEARKLAEEAYNKETDPAKKHAAAHQRALLYTDIDDEIDWLRRGNLADPRTKASLAISLGNKAIQDGKNDEAAKHLREAIDLYGRQAQSEGVLNNTALAYLSLFRATGDRSAIDKGFEMMERAVALKPSDSILLYNATHTMLEVALQDVIGPAIDFQALKASAGLDYLPFLYRDQAGREKYIELLRQHAGVAKARNNLERLLVLSPRKPQVYELSSMFASFIDDRAALTGLLRRLNDVELDLAERNQDMVDFYAGKNKYQAQIKSAVDRAEEGLQAARKLKKGVTLAVAASRLARARMQAAASGVPAEPDPVVALAEEAHAAAPSRATQSILTVALLFRADRTLAKQLPAYAALVQKYQRSLGPTYLIAFALESDADLKAKALANQDIQRAIQLIQEQFAQFPKDASEWEWAYLRAADPASAAPVAQAIQNDEAGRLSREIGRKLSPLSSSRILGDYWYLQLAGKQAEAADLLKKSAAQGVPLPVDEK